jgi:hypothetical protein
MSNEKTYMDQLNIMYKKCDKLSETQLFGYTIYKDDAEYKKCIIDKENARHEYGEYNAKEFKKCMKLCGSSGKCVCNNIQYCTNQTIILFKE